MSAKQALTLEDFAKLAGVTLIECEPEWGGRIGYKTADHPATAICGFRTEMAALNSWLQDTFGANAAKALKPLLKPRTKAAGRAPMLIAAEEYDAAKAKEKAK